MNLPWTTQVTTLWLISLWLRSGIARVELIVRHNIDPEGKATDAVLNNALSLIRSSPSASVSIREKFRLETEVATDGANFSAGEKQLREYRQAYVGA